MRGYRSLGGSSFAQVRLQTLLTGALVIVGIYYLGIAKRDTRAIDFESVSHLADTYPTSQQQSETTFTLRHIYHNAADGMLHRRLDIDDKFYRSVQNFETMDADGFDGDNPFEQEFTMKAQNSEIVRLANRDPDFVESYLNYALEVGQAGVSMISLDWAKNRISIPDVTDHETVLNLALMASDAYVSLPSDVDWKDVGMQFNKSTGFGWLGKGLRGQIFVNEAEDKAVIAIKGTSVAGLGNSGDGETVEQDKLNDNLLFSCCCARVSSLWTTVCDCFEGSYTCNQNCLEREFRRQDRYYKAVLDIYRNVTNMYPEAEIWVTGHSLGGALSSLLGRTFGLPAVTFEAPGELLATRRLHLPMPPGLPSELEHVWHFGNTADPIYMGVCNGASSTCAIAGYAMETQCHSGRKCTYDVVNDLGWHVNLLNHRLKKVIKEVLMVYNETAECVKAPPCYDCYNWKFVDHSRERFKTTTTRTVVPTPTPSDPPDRKCLKRTWYGRCYKWDDGDDDNLTSESTHSSHTKTTLVTKTKSREDTTSESLTSSSSSSSSFSTTEGECIRWSWLGYCLEYGHANGTSSTTGAPIKTSSVPRLTSISSFPTTTTSTTTTSAEPTCVGYNWYYQCTSWANQ